MFILLLAPEWLVLWARLGCRVSPRKAGSVCCPVGGNCAETSAPQASPTPRPLGTNAAGPPLLSLVGARYQSCGEGGVEVGWENSADRTGCRESGHSFPWIAAWEWPVNTAAGPINAGFCEGLIWALLSLEQKAV